MTAAAAAATVIITCEARCVRIDKYCSRERHDLQEDLLKEEKNKVARTHYHDFLIRGGGSI